MAKVIPIRKSETGKNVLNFKKTPTWLNFLLGIIGLSFSVVTVSLFYFVAWSIFFDNSNYNYRRELLRRLKEISTVSAIRDGNMIKLFLDGYEIFLWKGNKTVAIFRGMDCILSSFVAPSIMDRLLAKKVNKEVYRLIGGKPKW